MKERILLAEKKFDKETLHNVGALELNLQLLCPPDTRIYHQPSKTASPDRDYPHLIPKRKGYHYNTKKTEDLPKSASVRVNAVTVNVNTKPV